MQKGQEEKPYPLINTDDTDPNNRKRDRPISLEWEPRLLRKAED
jgi:hypothetical protein